MRVRELNQAFMTFRMLLKAAEADESLDEGTRVNIPELKESFKDILKEMSDQRREIQKEAREEEQQVIDDATEEIKRVTENLQWYLGTIDCPRCWGSGMDTVAVLGEHTTDIEIDPEEARKLTSLAKIIQWVHDHRADPTVAPVYEKMNKRCQLCEGKLRLPRNFNVPLDSAIKGCWIYREDPGSLRMRKDAPEAFTKPLVEAGLLKPSEADTGILWFTQKFRDKHLEKVAPGESNLEIGDDYYCLDRTTLNKETP